MLRRSIGAVTTAALVGLAAPLQAQKAQSSEAAAVRAANSAYHAAFSVRDITAMEAVWAKSPEAAAIHPFSRAPLSGWNAVRSSYVETFARFKDVSVSANEAHVAMNGNTAWVVSTETLRGHRPNGEAFTATSMSTNIFQKQGDRWLMVLHHAAGVPQ
ncbi:nuclear transport factor 2 family protein [Belnapia sp. T6]|uniref:Nuclear transport factor 2 family protein n=1 Tax=Belnapia mucosa TaxID=2804532 RepID=A0ABS1UZ18_9PROT|nr:nuclear transport factor 2 family protein [Belnapia mucosa]MBL6454542.1 nuclear transport factor 2 family protein [Belnapia mucosa]